MKKKDLTDKQNNIKENMVEDVAEVSVEDAVSDMAEDKTAGPAENREVRSARCDLSADDTIEKELEKEKDECGKLFEMLQRSAAEFDNYKKRTAREKETSYKDTVAEITALFLPVADNLTRALGAVKDDAGPEQIREGLQMVIKQMDEILEGLNVKEIEALGKKFDPQYHSAMLHVDDDQYGENEVFEVFEKGYTINGKVIRFSLVKVAN